MKKIYLKEGKKKIKLYTDDFSNFILFILGIALAVYAILRYFVPNSNPQYFPPELSDGILQEFNYENISNFDIKNRLNRFRKACHIRFGKVSLFYF